MSLCDNQCEVCYLTGHGKTVNTAVSLQTLGVRSFQLCMVISFLNCIGLFIPVPVIMTNLKIKATTERDVSQLGFSIWSTVEQGHFRMNETLKGKYMLNVATN